MSLIHGPEDGTYQFLLRFDAWNKRDPWPEGEEFKRSSNDPVGKLMRVIEQERPKQWLLVSVAIIVSLALSVGWISATAWLGKAVWLGLWKYAAAIPIMFGGSMSIGLFVYYLESRDLPTRFQILAISAFQLFLDDWEIVDARAIGPLLEAVAYWFPLAWTPSRVKDPAMMYMLAHTLPRLDQDAYTQLSNKQKSILRRLFINICEKAANLERPNVRWRSAPVNPERDLVLAVVRCSWVIGVSARNRLRKLAGRKVHTPESEQLIEAAKISLDRLESNRS